MNYLAKKLGVLLEKAKTALSLTLTSTGKTRQGCLFLWLYEPEEKEIPEFLK